MSEQASLRRSFCTQCGRSIHQLLIDGQPASPWRHNPPTPQHLATPPEDA